MLPETDNPRISKEARSAAAPDCLKRLRPSYFCAPSVPAFKARIPPGPEHFVLALRAPVLPAHFRIRQKQPERQTRSQRVRNQLLLVRLMRHWRLSDRACRARNQVKLRAPVVKGQQVSNDVVTLQTWICPAMVKITLPVVATRLRDPILSQGRRRPPDPSDFPRPQIPQRNRRNRPHLIRDERDRERVGYLQIGGVVDLLEDPT